MCTKATKHVAIVSVYVDDVTERLSCVPTVDEFRLVYLATSVRFANRLERSPQSESGWEMWSCR